MAIRLASINTQAALEYFKITRGEISDPLSPTPMVIGNGSPSSGIARLERAGVGVSTEVKDDYIGYLLDEPDSVLSTKTVLCRNQGAAGDLQPKQFTIKTHLVETMKRLCPAEIRALFCGRTAEETLRTLLFEYNINPNDRRTAVATIISLFINMMLERANKEMIYLRLFGNKGYTAGSNATVIANSVPANKMKFFNDLISDYDGLFAQMQAYVAAGQMPHVTSNGTAGTTAINPNYVNTFLHNVYNAASEPLKQRIRLNGDGVLFIDAEVIVAYRRYLSALGGNTISEIIRLGDIPYTGIRHESGMLLVPFEASTIFDQEEIGAFITSTIGGYSITHSRNLRGFLTMPENIRLITDGNNLASNQPMYTVNRSMEDDSDGVFVFKGFARTGVGIIEPQHMVAIWTNDTENFS